jgi:hypothetical protein
VKPTPLIAGVEVTPVKGLPPTHRWKLAFRDLSMGKYQATIIRTRNGR